MGLFFCVFVAYSKKYSVKSFFFKQMTAYEIMPSLVGSEMCIRDSIERCSKWELNRALSSILNFVRPIKRNDSRR